MKSPIRVLSTKKLLSNQKQSLLNAGYVVVEADFIITQNLEPDLTQIADNLIFTSQNGVASILSSKKADKLKKKTVFCVGKKTRQLLERNGFKVKASADYASELAKIITSEYADKKFTFFAGNLRLDTLVSSLKKASVEYNEITVYETVMSPNRISTPVDAILFFSPSAIQSYLERNTIGKEAIFCIGKTTANALEGITDNVTIANEPTIESTIVQCVNAKIKKLKA